MDKYIVGSEWRKWDLHVHTPESHGFTGDWEQFKIQLQQAECEVIGINDYFSVAGYKKIQEEIDNRTLDIGNKKIFPVVEMRMTNSVQNRHNSNVTHFNFHIIFNDDVDIAEIETFIKSLKYDGSNIGEKYTDKTELKDVKVSFDDTIAALESNQRFKDNYLIWLPYNEYGGIDEIDPVKDYRIKLPFIKKSDILGSSSKKQIDFFLWKSKLIGGKPKFTEDEFKQWFDVKKPCIKGSDSHSYKDKIGHLKDKDSKPINKYCWIKADPTFEGLKQIIYEPENRVFIGEKPPILSRIENNKTKYIDCLKINQINQHTGDIWFKDIQISLNKELVAIIGNKGSGKSGIADILGLVGDTHIDKKYFSFLNKKKFCKGKLSDGFKAEITWESGGKSVEIILSEDIKIEKPESVRFIPQNYFEELTNELEILRFQITLENIIFGYIPDYEKSGKHSFSELVEYKTLIINKSIEIEKNKIGEINSEIIALENKKNPIHIKKIEGLIQEKKIEIKAQEELLTELSKIVELSNDNERREQQDICIAKKQNKLLLLESELTAQENKKLELALKNTDLEQIKGRIKQQEEMFLEFISNNKHEIHGLDINNIFTIRVDYSSIEKLIKETKIELDEITLLLKSVHKIEQENLESDNKSICWKIKVANDSLQKEIKQLSAEQQVFQKNEQRKKEICEKIQILTGNVENPEPETLIFYEKEKTFVESKLQDELTNKRTDRLKLSVSIFSKKEEILRLYNSLKQAVDDKILSNRELLKDYNIKINASFNLTTSFYSDFLKHINQNKRGTFYGKEDGLIKIKSILEDDINNSSDIEAILINIIDSLELDNREESSKENRNISEQIKELDKFYEFLFSLDYLQPKYELILGDKTLDKLSPGERGALLLIFYLMIDKEDIPLIIDQPEDNLDNESVYNMLSKFIKKAKANRQIIMVTHNPNLAIGADAEQIIHVNIDKQDSNKFSFTSGSIENIKINKKIVRILEGTKPAFDKRKLKYQNNKQ